MEIQKKSLAMLRRKIDMTKKGQAQREFNRKLKEKNQAEVQKTGIKNSAPVL